MVVLPTVKVRNGMMDVILSVSVKPLLLVSTDVIRSKKLLSYQVIHILRTLLCN